MASKDDKKADAKPKADKPKGDKPVGGGEKKEKRQKGGAVAMPATGLPTAPEGYKSTASAPEPPRLKVKYRKEIIASLQKQFSYGNVMEVPRLQKIVINMGLGEAVQNPKIVESAVAELLLLTG